eukprot:9501990-Ditylum_brightwellii.AAC.1
MLKMTSLSNGNNEAVSVSQPCKDFFNSKSAGPIHRKFPILQSKHTQQLLLLLFLESSPVEASQISKRTLILHQVATKGQGKSLVDIKASAKQTVKAPSCFNNLNNQLSFWGDAFQIFFGPNSMGIIKVKKLIEKVQKRK